MNDQPSQTALAKALGLAKSRITALKKLGMPTTSIQAAQHWRDTHLNPARRKWPSARPPAPPPDRGAVQHADYLLDLAAAALQSGRSIEPLLPTLRSALAAVPPADRANLGLPINVMGVLIDHVVSLLPPRDDDPTNDDGSPVYCYDDAMTDAQAQDMGSFWYRVAAGERVIG